MSDYRISIAIIGLYVVSLLLAYNVRQQAAEINQLWERVEFLQSYIQYTQTDKAIFNDKVYLWNREKCIWEANEALTEEFSKMWNYDVKGEKDGY